MRSRVELFEQIRRDRRRGKRSIRELAEKYCVHRRTVRQALDSAVPPPRKAYPLRAAGDRSVRDGDRRLVACRRGRSKKVAAHGSTHPAAAGGRARRDGVGR